MSNEAIHQGHVHSDIEKGIATIEFFHPRSNSLPGKILAKIAETITELGKHPDVRVIILRSAGEKAFCAGASFDELLSLQDFPQSKQFFMGFANVINAIRKAPVFVIGRVHGKAVGGGVGLAAAVDYCFATSNADVKLSELAVGIGPFVVGPAVERKTGKSTFSDLSINASEWRSASWAREKGLYYQIFDNTTDMDQAIDALAKTLASSSPDAMKNLKQILWEGTENWDELLEKRAEISGRLILEPLARNILRQWQ